MAGSGRGAHHPVGPTRAATPDVFDGGGTSNSSAARRVGPPADTPFPTWTPPADPPKPTPFPTCTLQRPPVSDPPFVPSPGVGVPGIPRLGFPRNNAAHTPPRLAAIAPSPGPAGEDRAGRAGRALRGAPEGATDVLVVSRAEHSNRMPVVGIVCSRLEGRSVGPKRGAQASDLGDAPFFRFSFWPRSRTSSSRSCGARRGNRQAEDGKAGYRPNRCLGPRSRAQLRLMLLRAGHGRPPSFDIV